MASASEMALAMSADNSSEEKKSQPELEGSLDILFGEGEKVLVEEVGKEGEKCVSIVKTDRAATMSKY